MKKLMHIAMVALLAGAAVLYTGCTKDYTGEVKDLQSVTSSLQSQVDALKATDQSLQNAINQANGLITDLSNKEASDIAGINAIIEGINKSIKELQNKDTEILETIAKLELAVKEGDEKTLADAKKYADEQIASLAGELKGLINGEATARKEADEKLQGLIDGVVSDLAKEVLARQAEEAARAAADAGLQSQINEVNSLVSALSAKEGQDVAAIYQKISGEVGTINNTIDDVNGRIDDLEELVGKLVKSFKGRIQSIVAVVPGVGMPAEAVSYSFAYNPFPFAKVDTTVVEMKFNVSPAAAAAKVTKENATLVVTESPVATRGFFDKPDYCKEYVPTSVTVSGNVVTVKAIVAEKTNPENNYWVSLKVADTDEVEAPVEVISSPVKATEEVVKLSAENLKWYTKVNGADVPVLEASIFTEQLAGVVDLQYCEEGQAPMLMLAIDKQNYKEGFVAKAPFADYFVKVIYNVNGRPVAKTLPELAEMFGTEFELTSDATVAQMYGYIENEFAFPDANKLIKDNKSDYVTFAVSEDVYPAKTAGFTYKVEGDVNTREAVGLVGVYAEGAKINKNNEIVTPGMKINGFPIKNLAAVYTVRVAKDAKVVYPIEAPINNVWDYVNFAKTNTQPIENANGEFTNLAWSATTATEFAEGEATTIRRVVDGREFPVLGLPGTFSIYRTAAGYVTATVNGIPVAEKDADYVAVYSKNSVNKEGVEYYSYDTKINFSVEGRHANVDKSFELDSFVPVQTDDADYQKVEVKNFFATVFEDAAAWVGKLPKAQAAAAELYNQYQNSRVLNSVFAVETVGEKSAPIFTRFELSFYKKDNKSPWQAFIGYNPGTLKYGADYTVTFVDYKFGVPFKYTVKFSTTAPEFVLDYTSVVNPDGASVVVKGENITVRGIPVNRYILEDLHISKYLQVANVAKANAKEELTVECVYMDLTTVKDKEIGTVKEHFTENGKVFNNKTGKLYENDDYFFTWNKNFATEDPEDGDYKDLKFTAYFVLKAGGVVVPNEKYVTVTVGKNTYVGLPINFTTPCPITVSSEVINHTRQSGVANPINVLKTLSVKGILGNQELWNQTTTNWKAGVVSYGESILKKYFTGNTGYNVVWEEMTATFDGRDYPMTEGVDYTTDNDKVLTLLNENAVGTIEIKVPVQIFHYFDLDGSKPVETVVTIKSVLK